MIRSDNLTDGRTGAIYYSWDSSTTFGGHTSFTNNLATGSGGENFVRIALVLPVLYGSTRHIPSEYFVTAGRVYLWSWC